MEGVQSFQAQDVVVLAKTFRLTKPQHGLLSRGLSFIPTLDTGRNQKLQFQLDMQNYHRKIKLAAFFRNSDKNEALPFVGPSNWTPQMDKLPPEIQTLIHKDLEIFKKHYKPIREKFNISRQEVKALRELMNTKHIVIKPADKGSAVVILSREQYILEVERQLNDTVYYKKLEKPIYMETIPMVIDILDTLKKKKIINHKQRQYLIGNVQPRERRFYILPKIHKDPTKWTVPFEVPPGRPIVSDCQSETYYTAEYLDWFLTPLSVRHPAYVRDTYHFVEIVKSLQVPLDFYFFSLDVESLYTNIPIAAGITCVKKIFEKYPDPKRPDEELLKLLEINLTRNDFMFNDKFYLQIKGTAMGKKFAPAYANIFMANWEAEVLLKCKKQPAYYLRYLDDIWGIWEGSEEEFVTFLEILNSHDPSIKLKSEINKQTIDFLDTTVFRGPDFLNDSKLDIKVFFKSTDTHALLHKDSFHPKHTFKGIVKSQLLRFWRICTREEDFRKAVGTLFKALRKRGYGRTFLRRCLRTFSETKVRGQGNLIPLISTFSSISRTLNSKLKNNFVNEVHLGGLMPNSEVISAYKRNKNLADILVQAKLPSLTRERPLRLENNFSRLKLIKNQRTKTVHKITQGFSLRSFNCVYLIYCTKCGVQYVGETRNTLSTRMTQHKYNVTNKKELETILVKHFLLHGFISLKMAGIERNINWTDGDRKRRERFWIATLGTREPFGLNMKNN